MTTANSEVKKTLNALNERRVIEAGGNSDAWYRKWSDGFVEQGGEVEAGFNKQTTINLPIPYNDTKYVVSVAGKKTNNSGDIIWSLFGVRNVTNTSFIVLNGGATMPASWHACGYV